MLVSATDIMHVIILRKSPTMCPMCIHILFPFTHTLAPVIFIFPVCQGFCVLSKISMHYVLVNLYHCQLDKQLYTWTVFFLNSKSVFIKAPAKYIHVNVFLIVLKGLLLPAPTSYQCIDFNIWLWQDVAWT